MQSIYFLLYAHQISYHVQNLFTSIFLFFCSVLVAQKDTLQILKLIDDAANLEVSNPKASLKLYDKTYLLSKKANYKNGMYKSLINSAFPYSNMGMYDSAIYRFNKTIAFCKK